MLPEFPRAQLRVWIVSIKHLAFLPSEEDVIEWTEISGLRPEATQYARKGKPV